MNQLVEKPEISVGTTSIVRERLYRSRGLWGDASLCDHWDLTTASAPDQLAVVDAHGRRWTYAHVDERSDRLAMALRSRGIRSGAVVAVQLPNWSAYLVVAAACWKLGAVIVPLLTSYRQADLRYLLRASGATTLIQPQHFRRTDYRGMAREVHSALNEPALNIMVGEGNDTDLIWMDSLIESSQRLPRAERTPGRGNDLAAIIFTSGSESKPKGVMHSHNTLIAAERSFISSLHIDHRDRMFMPAPLAHATGFLHGLIMPVIARATSVWLDIVCGDAALDMINSEACTCGMASPTVVSTILDACSPGEKLTSSLRFFCCGGSPVPRALLHRIRAHGSRLFSVYGSTESPPHTLTTQTDDDRYVLRSDGRAAPDIEIQIVEPSTRTPLPRGVEGEQASRGPQVFLGYLNQPELTAEVLDSEGWYYSGDLCVMDEDGYIRITGRRKDVIIRGGENISPAEVEELIRSLPQVLDVAVVAMPDPIMGERACAYICLRPHAQPVAVADLRAHFINHGIAKFKIPERVEIVTELPMTESGKVRKGILRERIAAIISADGGNQQHLDASGCTTAVKPPASTHPPGR